MSNLILNLRIWCFHLQVTRDRPWLPLIRYNRYHRKGLTPFAEWYD